LRTYLFDYLKSVSTPIFLYGMGNGADKIIEQCEKRNIKIEGIFASDEFVRGQTFHGMTVQSYSQVRSKHSDIIILLCFGSSLPDVLDRIYALANQNELYAPDVPAFGHEVFDMDFYTSHREEINEARELFCDDASKALFDALIDYKLSGDIKLLKNNSSTEDEIWASLSLENYSIFVDAGAYNGDTAEKILSYAPNAEIIYAIEPDSVNYRKLISKENVYEHGKTPNAKICAINAACWNEKTQISFYNEGNRNSSAETARAKGKKLRLVNAIKLDDLCEVADFIKFDVEGAEKEALDGSIKLIRSSLPTLLVSAYHRSEDIFSLPLQIHRIAPEYKLMLRKAHSLPAWDIVIIATKQKDL